MSKQSKLQMTFNDFSCFQENVMCKPSPTVVQLPLPNNTDVQQVKI